MTSKYGESMCIHEIIINCNMLFLLGLYNLVKNNGRHCPFVLIYYTFFFNEFSFMSSFINLFQKKIKIFPVVSTLHVSSFCI